MSGGQVTTIGEIGRGQGGGGVAGRDRNKVGGCSETGFVHKNLLSGVKLP